MLSFSDITSGTHIILESEPYEVLKTEYTYKAQRTATLFAQLRNLLTGKMIERTFRQGNSFEEAEVAKQKTVFVFAHRGQYTFAFADNPSQRFTLPEEQVKQWAPYLVPHSEVIALVFEGKVRSIELPIKMNFKITEAPPGVKGDRAQGGTKTAVIETGLRIQVPLFVEEGDTIEINTSTGQYVQRIEKSK